MKAMTNDKPPDAAELTPLAKGEHSGRTQLEAQLEVHPNNARAWYDLGCAYNRGGRYEEAVRALDCSLTLSPHNVGIQGALAYALSGIGNLGDAGILFESVIHQDPGNGWAYFHLGSVRFQQNVLPEAVELWECAFRLLEDPSDSLENLAMAYRRLGKTEKEKHSWQRLREFSAEHPAVRHMLAAHGEAPLDSRADDAYLRHLFDRFAMDFDGVLQALDYRVPELLEARLCAIHDTPTQTLRILDAGCGTGLCGERLRPWARHLTGVDISSGMLEKARQRDIYNDLLESELTAFLASTDQRYDCIVAGDVLCYFGSLKDIITAATRCLLCGGRLFLTVEKDQSQEGTSGPGYRLQIHGRYCHTQAYVEATALAAGSNVEELSTEILRHESGEPVEGVCAVLLKI